MKTTSLFRMPWKFILFFLFIIVVLNCSAQIKKPTSKPFMWVPSKEGQDEIDSFNTIKLKPISDAVNRRVPQTNELLLGNFWKMITHFRTAYSSFDFLRVYIGITSQANLPDSYKNKLILIFAPGSSIKKGSDLGYYILPEPFDINHPRKWKISKAQKQLWTERFIRRMPLKTIDHNSDNQYPSSLNSRIKTHSDTRYTTYCAKDIVELDTVRKYFAQTYPISDNLKAFFGAYPDSGMHRGALKGRFKKRILTIFQLLDNSNNEANLDTIPEFDSLPPATLSLCPEFNVRIVAKKKPKFVSRADNGQLCPTFCPK